MNTADIELEIWHAFLAAGIFFITVGIPLWRQYKATLAKERAAGAAEQIERNDIHNKLNTGAEKFARVNARLDDVEKGIKQLHQDHGEVQDRLGRIEIHMNARNGQEKAVSGKLDTIIQFLKNKPGG